MKNSTAYIITLSVLAVFGYFFIYPVASVVEFAYQDEDGKFTLDFFIEAFKNPIYLEGLRNALLIGIVSTFATFLIAFPLSFITHKFDFPGKKWLSILILIPLVLPPFVGAIGVKYILGVQGALNTFLIDKGFMQADAPYDWLGEGRFWGIIIMNALHLYPILYINITAALNQLDPAMDQSAQNLGCPPWRRFRKITLPLCMPGIFAGAAIVFIWSFTELGVPLVFEYTRVTPVQIYNGIKDLDSNPMPYALVSIMLMFSFLIFIASKLIIRNVNTQNSTRAIRQNVCINLGKKFGWIISLAFTLVVLTASIPHAGVLFLSFSTDWYQSVLPEAFTLQHFSEGLGHPLVMQSIENSLFYSSTATIINIILGLAIAYVIVRSTIWGRSILDATMMLPLAVPGLVLAFGYLAMSDEGQPFHFLMGSHGSPALLLIIAYAMRRLPYIVRAAVAGLEQSNPALEEAALSLGATPIRMIRRVAVPLIGANLVAGAILAFAFAMLEVSDSLILAQQSEHFPITKVIYSLLTTLGNGHEIAAALGVWAMVFLGIAITGAFVLVGKRSAGLFRL